jgi:biopolymer transport protein ExbD
MDEKEFDSINVIPFVDIMLVLLTIVLVTATFISVRAIPVKLPETKYTKEIPSEKGINLVITKEGEILFEKRGITLSELEELLKAHSSHTPVIVNVDKESRSQHLISILDLLKNYSFHKITIKTVHKGHAHK